MGRPRLEARHAQLQRTGRWYNPNGLPDARQWTSARDMAVLGRALIRDFPESRALFSISAIQFGKSIMANHNGLLGRYAGADGMKTGFICAGGFNVVASATRNGRRLITVVMGQPSARERDLKAADLFDHGFSQSAGWTAQTLDALPSSSISEPPDMRPYICDKRRPMPVDEGPGAIASQAGNENASILAAAAPVGSALAFATLNNGSMKGRALPPRAPLQPILVWIGRDPAEGAIALNEQAEAEKAEKAAKLAELRKAKVEAANAKREASRLTRPDAKSKAPSGKAAVPASASAYAPVETTPVIAGGGKPSTKAEAGKKPAGKAVAKPGQKTSDKPAAKAEAKPSAKPGVKPAKSATRTSGNNKTSAASSAED